MMNNKNLRFEQSCFNVELRTSHFLFQAHVLRCLLKVKVLRLLVNRKKGIQHLRLPFNMKRIQQGTLVR